MWTKIFFRYESSGLPKDCAARSRVQLMVCRNRESFCTAISQSTPKFDVTSSLRVDRETEMAKYCDDLRA